MGFIHNEKPGLHCIPAICTALLPPIFQNSGMVLEKIMIEVQNTAQTYYFKLLKTIHNYEYNQLSISKSAKSAS